MKTLQIYIIHSKHLTERRKIIDNIRKEIGKYNFKNIVNTNIQIIDTDEPSDISTEFIHMHVNYNATQREEDIFKKYNSLIKVLHINNISNSLKHLKAYKKIVECANPNTIHMILEDDVMYEPRVCSLLDNLFEKLTNNDDIVFLGMPNNESITENQSVTIKSSKSIFNILPYNDSYIISPQLARRIIDIFFPLKFYTNIQLSYIFDTLGIEVKQTVPNIFVDGTKVGNYLSSQLVNNELFFNKDYMFVKNILNRQPFKINKDEMSILENIINSSNIANNPDFLYIYGKLKSLIGNNYKECHSIYQKANDIYNRNNCIINNESSFLRDFISLHVHLQNL